MIAYRLCCHKGHEFEAWFRDSVAYDAQAGTGQLCCPDCGSPKVEKAIMAPAVAGTRKAATAVPAVSAEDARRMRQFATGIRKYVQDNAHYVGPAFPEEARKIHYGESSERHIYGEATMEEARDLVEEGIDVAALPPDPEAAN